MTSRKLEFHGETESWKTPSPISQIPPAQTAAVAADSAVGTGRRCSDAATCPDGSVANRLDNFGDTDDGRLSVGQPCQPLGQRRQSEDSDVTVERTARNGGQS
jgi:hypothetical protein